MISTVEALQKETELIVYDVRDIIMPIPDFENAPTLDLGNFGGGGGGLGGGGQGGGGGAAAAAAAASAAAAAAVAAAVVATVVVVAGPAPNYTELEEENLDKLKSIIRDNVDSESWREYGGTVSQMEDFNKNLIISSTPKNHMEINSLLRMLREARSILINVEARFLEVDTDWFEEIGVDLDMYFNTNSDLWDQASQADPNARLSDFFVSGGAQDGQLKDSLIYGSVANSEQVGTSLQPAAGAPAYVNTVNTGMSNGIPDPGVLPAPTDFLYYVHRFRRCRCGSRRRTPVGVPSA